MSDLITFHGNHYRRDTSGWYRVYDEQSIPIYHVGVAALDEIERLRAIVNRLPKTADGVPMVPGIRLWVLWFGKIQEVVHLGTDPETSCFGISSIAYSTREAAEAARKAEDGE